MFETLKELVALLLNYPIVLLLLLALLLADIGMSAV